MSQNIAINEPIVIEIDGVKYTKSLTHEGVLINLMTGQTMVSKDMKVKGMAKSKFIKYADSSLRFFAIIFVGVITLFAFSWITFYTIDKIQTVSTSALSSSIVGIKSSYVMESFKEVFPRVLVVNIGMSILLPAILKSEKDSELVEVIIKG